VDQFEPEAFTDAAGAWIVEERSRSCMIRAITALGSKFRHKVSVEVQLREGTVERETRGAARRRGCFRGARLTHSREIQEESRAEDI